jgi:uncharacterized protein
VIRRLRLPLPETARGQGAGRDAIRLLAVADDRDTALDHEHNRRELGAVDAVLGCGDLDPDYLAFVADAFGAPLLLVRGNHDRGAAWENGRQRIATPLEAEIEAVAGIHVLGLSWPGPARGRAARSELAAWRQAIGAWLRSRLRRTAPQVVISHVPPLGRGDAADDPYHTGFAAYRWLLRRLRPAVWLHGHTHPAQTPDWRSQMGATSLANVTGAVLVELTAGAERTLRTR